METSHAFPLALAGLLIGAACGYATRRARLCSFGAIEDFWLGGDTRRLRVFGLALAIALLGAQALILAGTLDPGRTAYAPTAIPWLAATSGGLAFGFGMALVGTCGFGCLVRLGAGDLRSLVVLIVFGAVAYAALRGALAPARIDILEAWSIPVPGGARGDLASLLAALGLGDVRLAITLGAAALLIGAVAIDPRLRRSPRLIAAGTTLGLGVVAGWAATSILADEFAIPSRAVSLTFVAPVGRALYGAMTDPATLLELGVGSVFGVALGSFVSAWRDRELRWEAFDDHHEMKRHLLGGALMGFGGVAAGGCTIGQGVTAGSMMALSWPFAIGGIMIGARIGVAVLVEGSLREAFGRFSWRPGRR